MPPKPPILIAIAFMFAPLGPHVSEVLKFDASKLFVITATLAVLKWLLPGGPRFPGWPKYLRYFCIFALLHIAVTYVILFPGDLSFGIDEHLNEGAGRRIIRFVIFSLFGYVLSATVKHTRQLRLLAFAYGIGTIISIILTRVALLTGETSRFAGGFLNPNSFGTSCVVATFLNLAALCVPQRNKLLRVLPLSAITFALFGIVTSVSRSAILGLVAGLMFAFLNSKSARYKIHVATISLLLGALALRFVPDNIMQVVDTRIDLEYSVTGSGAYRTQIWTGYLKNVRKYAFTGLGAWRHTEAIKEIRWRGKGCHNSYLASFVQYGIIGIALLLLALGQLWRNIVGSQRLGRMDNLSSALLGLFVSWACMSFFGTMIESSRDTWIVIGLIAAYGSRQLQRRNLPDGRLPPGLLSQPDPWTAT